jgi:hypothetical protein
VEQVSINHSEFGEDIVQLCPCQERLGPAPASFVGTSPAVQSAGDAEALETVALAAVGVRQQVARVTRLRPASLLPLTSLRSTRRASAVARLATAIRPARSVD